MGPDDEVEPEAVGGVEEGVDDVEEVVEGDKSVLAELNNVLMAATETVDVDCEPPGLPAFGHSAFTPCPWKNIPIKVPGSACKP